MDPVDAVSVGTVSVDAVGVDAVSVDAVSVDIVAAADRAAAPMPMPTPMPGQGADPGADPGAASNTDAAPRVVATADYCIAAGECARIAPSVFAQRKDDGTVFLRDGFTLTQPVLKQVRHAVDACPARALELAGED